MSKTKGAVMEKILKINCVDVGVVRIVCKDCQTAMDIPIQKLTTAGLQCPGCAKVLRRPDVDGAVRELAHALFTFYQHKDVELHFVVPAPE